MIEGLTEHFLSPVKYGDGRTERIFQAKRGEGWALLKSLGNNYVTTDGYLDMRASRVTAGPALDTVSAIFNPAATDITGLLHQEGLPEYNVNINWLEKPLETCPKYRRCWNYDLYQAIDTTLKKEDVQLVIPSWARTQKSFKVPDGEEWKYCWAQSNPGEFEDNSVKPPKKYRWQLIEERIKKGEEVWYYPQPVIVEKIYSRSKKGADSYLKKAGQLIAPADVSVYPKENAHWLCMPQGRQKEGDWFTAVTHFVYADKWDDDEYPIQYPAAVTP